MDEHIDMDGHIENNMPFTNATTEIDFHYFMLMTFITNEKEIRFKWRMEAEFNQLQREITNLI